MSAGFVGNLRFRPGDHVNIKPLDGISARVISVEWMIEGTRYQVRYFDHGDAKVVWLFDDELVA